MIANSAITTIRRITTDAIAAPITAPAYVHIVVAFKLTVKSYELCRSSEEFSDAYVGSVASELTSRCLFVRSMFSVCVLIGPPWCGGSSYVVSLVDSRAV